MAKIKSAPPTAIPVEQAPEGAPTAEPTANGKAAKKTACPITREQFVQKGTGTLNVTIGERQFPAMKKEFSTGSLGWNLNDKMDVMVDGVAVKCQVGLNITVINSKGL